MPGAVSGSKQMENISSLIRRKFDYQASAYDNQGIDSVIIPDSGGYHR